MPQHRGERLSAADASNVVLDAFVSRDGSVDLEQLRTFFAARLRGRTGPARFSQRVVHEGRALVWEPAEPDLGWHVRTVGPVAGLDGLAALCAKLMTTPLPADRPLWELLVP